MGANALPPFVFNEGFHLSGIFLPRYPPRSRTLGSVAHALKPSRVRGSAVKFRAPAVNGWRELWRHESSPVQAEKCPSSANFQGTQETEPFMPVVLLELRVVRKEGFIRESRKQSFKMNLQQEFEELTAQYELTSHKHFLMRCAFERGVRVGIINYIECDPNLADEIKSFEDQTERQALAGT